MKQENNITLESLFALFQKTGEQIQAISNKISETEKFKSETEKFIMELSKSVKEQSKSIREQSKQIGAVSHSIGNLNEGLTFPSVAHELEHKFNMQFVGANIDKKIDGKKLELDVLAYSNGTLNQVMIVEIKTNLTSTAIKQLESNLRQFRDFFPEHNDKVVFGVIAASKAREKEIKAVLKAGFYFAAVNEGLFSIQVPKDFKPKAF